MLAAYLFAIGDSALALTELSAAVSSIILTGRVALIYSDDALRAAGAIADWLGANAKYVESSIGNISIASQNGLQRVRIYFGQRSGRFIGPHIQFEQRSFTNRPFQPVPGIPSHIYFGG